MALLFWSGIQLENMITRIENIKDATFENFSVLVEELKMEFETKKLNAEAVLVFKNGILAADISKRRLQIMHALMSDELQEYTNAKHEEVAGVATRC